MSFDWKAALGAVAPTIATALGGPMAGVAVKMAADALGCEPTEDALAAAIQTGDPNVMLQLKKANQDFLKAMRELDIKEKELELADVADARERQERTGDQFVTLLAGVVVAGFFTMLWYVLTGQAQVESALAGTLIGYASAKADQVLTYFFGSSKGSKEKTSAMTDAIKKAAR